LADRRGVGQGLSRMMAGPGDCRRRHEDGQPNRKLAARITRVSSRDPQYGTLFLGLRTEDRLSMLVARSLNKRPIDVAGMDDLIDDERQALIAAAHKALADDPFPRAPRLHALRNALAKLDPASVPRPIPPFKAPPAAPTRSRGGRKARR
jgi:hypothetical protein